MPDKLTDNEREIDDMCPRILMRNALDLIDRVQAENERLKELFEHSQANYWNISNLVHKYRNKAIIAKAEAYKEFAEKLKPKFKNIISCNAGAVYRKIDNLLKELVGEDK